MVHTGRHDIVCSGPCYSRMLSDSISQTFSSLEGRRSEPVSVAVLSAVKPQSIDILQEQPAQDTLSLIWDIDWLPIKDSNVLLRYWSSDLAREAVYRSLQKRLIRNLIKGKLFRVGLSCNTISSQLYVNSDSST